MLSNDVPAAETALPVRLDGRPVLTRWIGGVNLQHPVVAAAVPVPDDPQQDPVLARQLDVYEDLLATLEAGGADRWKAKRDNDFPAVTSHGQLLDLRAELVVGRALQDAAVNFRLGNTKIANPDLVLSDHNLGIEVTAKAPLNIAALNERLEDILRDFPGMGLQMSFSVYPTRLASQPVEELAAKVATAIRQAQRDHAKVTVQQVVEDPKNAATVTIEVVLKPNSVGALDEPVSWEVLAGTLQGPLSSAEHAVFEIGSSPAKAKQARSMAGGVILAVDLSRYGGAWMRPAAVWPGCLAQRFTPTFPFAAIAVFRQDLMNAHIVEPAVAISSHAPLDTQQRIMELVETMSWPHALGPDARTSKKPGPVQSVSHRGDEQSHILHH
ncbi:hypothetical protein ACFWY5_11880 [Nonomuraea sp. NPDC059007]|uniref:hypothetical protein n=1 Tax=Nonomuraea sp. NPDC059007 TaxID=3346692 RepID=UPI0036AFFB59